LSLAGRHTRIHYGRRCSLQVGAYKVGVAAHGCEVQDIGI
jgi:hypothetical protein